MYPLKIKHPLSRREDLLYPISTVLKDLAAQENCDGEPYDQMQDAAEYIEYLEEELRIAKGLLTCDYCGELIKENDVDVGIECNLHDYCARKIEDDR